MSTTQSIEAASGEPADQANPSDPSRELLTSSRDRAGRVIGICIGLLVLLGLFSVLAKPGKEGPGQDALLAELMPSGCPSDFEVASANTLPTGETVLRLVSRESDGSGPEELLFVLYSSNGAAEADMRGNAPTRADGHSSDSSPGSMMEDPSLALDQWNKEPNFAMHLTTEKGQILWGAWRAARATERSLRADGTWRESMRVNLSQKDRFLVLFAQWPAGELADPEQLEAILERVAMS